MRLRKQLSLLGLLFFLLPVASFLFVREIEQLLRLGQEQALIASASAVADRIGAEFSLVTDLERANEGQELGPALYVYSSEANVTLDGYDDDWRFLKLTPQIYSTADLRMELMLKASTKALSGFVTVADQQFNFHQPSVDFPASGDFIGIFVVSEDQRGFLVFRTSAPGEMQAVFKTGDSIQLLHGAKAVWRETGNGYQVEFELPLTFSKIYLSLGVYDEHSRTWLSNMGSAAVDAAELFSKIDQWPIRKPVTRAAGLEQVSTVFTHASNRLRVVNREHWVMADTDRLSEITQQPAPMAWLIQWLLNDEKLTAVEREFSQAKVGSDEVAHAIATGEQSSKWYKWNQSSNLLRVSVPILDSAHAEAIDKKIIGAVVAEQTTYQWLALADKAFKRLLIYSGFALAVVALILLLYATWLSLRIQRLSAAAARAINADGSINASFPPSKFKDEIGDLHRRYAELLSTVAQYNEYLRTLASKLSHELRTPLAIVKSSLDNLQATQSETDQSIYIHRAQEGTDRLSNILTAMNSARRIEESIGVAEFEIIDVAALIRELSQAYRQICTGLKINVCTDLPPGPVMVAGAPDLLVQMFDKLFDNATDFCNSGGTITLGAKVHEQKVKLWVHNTGSLLPEQMAQQIFSSMVSVRDQSSESPHLGLGLYIVKLVVDCHKGTVCARNSDDRSGVIFKMFLPSATLNDKHVKT